MRWRFSSEHESEDHRQRRNEILEHIDVFWGAWRRRDIARARGELERIDGRLILEPDDAADGDPGWVVAVSGLEVVPLRDVMFERAPRDLRLPMSGRPRRLPSAVPIHERGASDRVAIDAHAPGLDIIDLEAMDPETIDLETIDLEKSRVRIGVGRGHLLGIVMDPACAETPPGLENACELLAEALIGELPFLRWVRSVDVAPLPKAGALPVLQAGTAASHPAARLGDLFDIAVNGILRGLPEEPSWGRVGQSWTLFELEPNQGTESAFAAQDDVVLVSTSCPELVKTFLEGAPFYSGRFSTRGELFAYVKYESPATDSRRRLAERDELEAAVHAALASAQLGGVMGVGLGLRYAYLDLALSNAEQAIVRLSELGQRGVLPERSWLLFFDSELEEEWVGLGTPDLVPPMSTERFGGKS